MKSKKQNKRTNITDGKRATNIEKETAGIWRGEGRGKRQEGKGD